jgi:hypothetical protein
MNKPDSANISLGVSPNESLGTSDSCEETSAEPAAPRVILGFCYRCGYGHDELFCPNCGFHRCATCGDR